MKFIQSPIRSHFFANIDANILFYIQPNDIDRKQAEIEEKKGYLNVKNEESFSSASRFM